jgi:hypothetical protein
MVMYGWLMDLPENQLRKIKYKNKDQIDAFWPLSVGNKAQWTAKLNGVKLKYDAEVTAFEQVRGPAGEFDAFFIRNNSKNLASQVTTEKKRWYAPTLGVVVKTMTRQQKPGSGSRSGETNLLSCSHETREFTSKINSK